MLKIELVIIFRGHYKMSATEYKAKFLDCHHEHIRVIVPIFPLPFYHNHLQQKEAEKEMRPGTERKGGKFFFLEI